MSEYTQKLFWAKVIKTDYCWEFIGTPSQEYPIIRIAGKNIKAHRYSYSLANGGIQPDEIIDHLCMNKKCVNPAHLESVSCKENLVRAHKSTHCATCKCAELEAIPKGIFHRRTPNIKDESLKEWIISNTTPYKDCWIWNGASAQGYGSMHYKGKTGVVHRILWELVNGKIADSYDLHHKCEIRLCCNPQHLEPMSRSDNLKEIWKRAHCAGCRC